MAINNQICLFILILTFGCGSKKNEETPEIRVYKVNEFISDPFRYDTLIMDPTHLEGFSKMIYEIDSVLEINYESMVPMLGYTISINGYDKWGKSRLAKYIVEIPIEYGEIELFGIYAQGIGSVYFRWLDGSKSLVLEEKLILGQKYRYDKLIDYINTTILAIPRNPHNILPENMEIEGDIEVDTSMIRK